MYSDILIMGACELEHFELFAEYGFDKFILCNNPAFDNFISMKVIKEVFELYPKFTFYLLEVPSEKEIYLYYQSVFESYGFSLKFFDDLEKLKDVKYLNSFKNISCMLDGKSLFVFDIQCVMINYRLLDVENTKYILGRM